MRKNLVIWSIALSLSPFSFSQSFAKKIYPAEIMGRDLLIPGLGWAGHVGISNRSMFSADGMQKEANVVIEVLNENPVGQINSISDFKSRSKYWGSKYGVADRGFIGYNVIVEANHQRWWCPKYTNDTSYHIGSGIPTTGEIIECGTWRCDTYAWWAFYSQGLDTMPGKIWLPKILFDFFPYYNDEKSITKPPTKISELSNNKSLEDYTAEELNNMSYEDFQMIMDAPPTNYVTAPPTVQMQFAHSERLNDTKREIMIDRLIAKDSEPDLVKKLLNLYNETNNIKVKNKIVQGLMLSNQRHRHVKAFIQNDQPLLKAFFADLLNSDNLSSEMADDVIRGFIDTSSPDEIMNNRNQIDKWLPTTGHYSSVMLKYTLVHKSQELQGIYIKSIVNELRSANNSDLDSYFFGPLSMGYQNTGKNLLEPESKKIVADYLKEVRHKYTPQGIQAKPNDTHRITTAPYYFELIKYINM